MRDREPHRIRATTQTESEFCGDGVRPDTSHFSTTRLSDKRRKTQLEVTKRQHKSYTVDTGHAPDERPRAPPGPRHDTDKV